MVLFADVFGVALVVISAALIAYWLLITSEGVYLGQTVVTWLYDIYAAKYDSIKNFESEFEDRFLAEPIVKFFRRYPAPTILDIGSGTGRLPFALLNRADFNGRIIGIDHSTHMLAQASQKLSPFSNRVTLLTCDGMSLPFFDQQFECVALIEMIEFTRSPEEQIREAFRVLGPGGLLVITRRRGLNAALMPGKTHSRIAFKRLLESVGLFNVQVVAWQVEYDLIWATRPGSLTKKSRNLIEVLRCTRCQAAGLTDSIGCLVCPECGTVYPVGDGIINMNL